MRALITGITGMVGSWMADYLLEQGIEVYGIKRWRSPTDNISHLLGKITLYDADLTDINSLQNVLAGLSPDYVFHFAAQSYVPYSYTAPIATLEANVIGSTNLLEMIRYHYYLKRVRILICSSSEVYGQVKEEDVPIKETCPLRPVSPYGVSKVAEDMIGYMYWKAYGIHIIRSRLFTHTGPRRGEVFHESAFAKQIALIEKGLQEPVIRVGNLGSVRTYLDVRDAVRAYWLMIIKCTPGEVYNIGGNTTMKVGEMLEKMLELSPVKDKISIQVDKSLLRPADITLQIPDCSKFKAETRWEPKILFKEQTLVDLLNYWRDRV